MLVGEDLEVEDYFIDYFSDEEMSDDSKEVNDFHESSEDTELSPENNEEEFDYGEDADDFLNLVESERVFIQEILQDIPEPIFEGIIIKEQRLLTKEEYEQGIRLVALRLLCGTELDDTTKMINYCIILGPRLCLTCYYTGIMLEALCDRVKAGCVPETLEILMRRFANLSGDYRNIVIFMMAHDINNIKGSLVNIGTFLTRIIMSLLENEDFKDSKSADEIIPPIHKIFCDLKNDPVSIHNITTPNLVDGLLTLLDSRALDLRNKYTIIQILAIIACNSEDISQTLMGGRAVLKIWGFNEKHHAGPDNTKMDIATLIWAILPPLKEQEFFDEYEVISETIPSPTWQKEIQKGIWVSFPQPINFLIEQNYGRIMEFSFIESGTIHTVEYIKMLVYNETTSEQTAIIREYITPYNVMNLKKNKQEFGSRNTEVSDYFSWFAFLFFCSRMNYVYPNSPEEYRCWQGLFTLFESITPHQYEQLLEQESDHLSGNSLVTRIKNLLNGNNYDLRILAVRVVSRLITVNPPCFSKKDDRNVIMATIQSIAKQNKVSKDSAQTGVLQNLDWKMKEKCLQDLAARCIEMPSAREVLENNYRIHHPLEIMFETLMNTPNDIKQNSDMRTVILNSFLEFLAEPDGQPDRNNRLRDFLFVFSNVTTHPQDETLKTPNELFLVLLRKLKSMILDSLGSFPIKWDEDTENRILKAGGKTIRSIAAKSVNICVYINVVSPCPVHYELTVLPFTTIQYLKYHMLLYTSLNMHEEKFFDASKIELFMNGHLLPSEITIYEAIRRFGSNNGDKLFEVEHVIKFERKTRCGNKDNHCNPYAHPLDRHLRKRIHSEDIPEDIQKAFQLMDILYGLNKYWTSLYTAQTHSNLVDPKEFEMDSLSNMADISFKDPFGILVGKSPAWIHCLLENCPFIFRSITRKMAFRVLRLDRRRSFETVMKKFSHFESNIFTDKILIRRNNLLDDVNEALRLSPSYSSWSISFDDEVGTGVGLKRELFTIASRNLLKAELNMWSASDLTDAGYIKIEKGLYPVISLDVDQQISEDQRKENLFLHGEDFTQSSLEEKFETVGLLLGKALIEELMLDIPLALPIFNWILKQENLLTIDDLKHINPFVYNVLKDIQKMVEKREKIRSQVDINNEILASYGLSFVVPGYNDIELIPGGADVEVTLENARMYLDTLEQFFFNFGVQKQMNALRKGLNSILNLDHLQIFHPEELQMMICGDESDDYWSVGKLKRYIVVDGFESHETAVIDNLFDILSSLSRQKRRLFLEFVTGCANLPVGGFESLSPRLKINRSEGSYPHAQTCFHTLYMPVNMSKSELRQFIELAITEGLEYFGLA